MTITQTSGKRKTAHAHAVATEGKGRVRVNSVPLELVSPKIARLKIMEPLMLAGPTASALDIEVRTSGGGSLGSAEAARLAIGKALVKINPSLKATFLEYDRNLLVADVRRRETRKPNTHGKARSKVQKSYR